MVSHSPTPDMYNVILAFICSLKEKLNKDSFLFSNNKLHCTISCVAKCLCEVFLIA